MISINTLSKLAMQISLAKNEKEFARAIYQLSVCTKAPELRQYIKPYDIVTNSQLRQIIGDIIQRDIFFFISPEKKRILMDALSLTVKKSTYYLVRLDIANKENKLEYYSMLNKKELADDIRRWVKDIKKKKGRDGCSDRYLFKSFSKAKESKK